MKLKGIKQVFIGTFGRLDSWYHSKKAWYTEYNKDETDQKKPFNYIKQ